jgi:hypothetical protein
VNHLVERVSIEPAPKYRLISAAETRIKLCQRWLFSTSTSLIWVWLCWEILLLLHFAETKTKHILAVDLMRAVPGYTAAVVLQRRSGPERLSVIRYTVTATATAAADATATHAEAEATTAAAATDGDANAEASAIAFPSAAAAGGDGGGGDEPK